MGPAKAFSSPLLNSIHIFAYQRDDEMWMDTFFTVFIVFSGEMDGRRGVPCRKEDWFVQYLNKTLIFLTYNSPKWLS
jgi:hypothetical protein